MEGLQHVFVLYSINISLDWRYNHENAQGGLVTVLGGRLKCLLGGPGQRLDLAGLGHLLLGRQPRVGRSQHLGQASTGVFLEPTGPDLEGGCQIQI